MISLNLKKRFYTSILLLLLLLLTFAFNVALIYALIVLGVISIIEFLNLIKKVTQNKIFQIFFNQIFIIYLVSLFTTLFYLSNFSHLKVLIYILLLGCIFSDIGGFIFGNIFKGPKLTKISPKKTYTGVLGSVIFTNLIMISLLFYTLEKFNYMVIIIGMITSISCQIGDLFFSYLKRKANIKDTGNFLPGHGGILDRLDGIFLGLPLGFLALIFFY
jgi:phosphatidate cytidylyltransferase